MLLVVVVVEVVVAVAVMEVEGSSVEALVVVTWLVEWEVVDGVV